MLSAALHHRHSFIIVYLLIKHFKQMKQAVPILVFLGLSVLDLGPMYATDRRQTDKRQTSDKSIA